MVTLDHPIQSLSIDCEDARCRLLVSTSVFEHAGNIATFDLRKWHPIFNCRLFQRNLRIRTTLRRRKNVFRLQHTLLYSKHFRSHQTKRVAAFHKLYLQWDAAARRVGEDVRGCSAIVYQPNPLSRGGDLALVATPFPRARSSPRFTTCPPRRIQFTVNHQPALKRSSQQHSHAHLM